MRPWFTILPFLPLIHCAPKECYHAARFEKDTRYYVIRLSRDLLEDWVITIINGRIKAKLGQVRTLAFANFGEGLDHFCTLAKVRHQRGYQLKTIACDNHLMLHLLPFIVDTPDKNEVPAAKIIKSLNQRERSNRKTASISNNRPPNAPSQQLGFAF